MSATVNGKRAKNPAPAETGKNAGPRPDGQVMIELVLGVLAMVLVLGAIALQFAAQARLAYTVVQTTRVRLVLEGELERMRGLPPGRLRPAREQPFTPALASPAMRRRVRFTRTIVVARDGTADVSLRGRLKASRAKGNGVLVEGTVFPAGPEERRAGHAR